MKRQQLFSKSVLRRVKTQLDLQPPTHIQERIDALLLQGDNDQAGAVFKQWLHTQISHKEGTP